MSLALFVDLIAELSDRLAPSETQLVPKLAGAVGNRRHRSDSFLPSGHRWGQWTPLHQGAWRYGTTIGNKRSHIFIRYMYSIYIFFRDTVRRLLLKTQTSLNPRKFAPPGSRTHATEVFVTIKLHALSHIHYIFYKITFSIILKSILIITNQYI